MGREQRLGLTIGSAFGLVFVLVNAGALPSPWPLLLRIGGVVAFVGVQLALRQAARRPAAERTHGGGGFTRGYWLIAAVEVVALVAGVQVLARVLDVPEAGVAWVSLVVGVHFNALAVVWRESSLHVLGAALTACGVAGLALAAVGADEAPIAAVGGVVPGFVLLAGAAWAANQGPRVPQPA
jgi:hypothetical protein